VGVNLEKELGMRVPAREVAEMDFIENDVRRKLNNQKVGPKRDDIGQESDKRIKNVHVHWKLRFLRSNPRGQSPYHHKIFRPSIACVSQKKSQRIQTGRSTCGTQTGRVSFSPPRAMDCIQNLPMTVNPTVLRHDSIVVPDNSPLHHEFATPRMLSSHIATIFLGQLSSNEVFGVDATCACALRMSVQTLLSLQRKIQNGLEMIR
jgi:hypothetical protein